MINASNGLSFVRAPLAFLFLQDNATLRIIAVLLAMFTDSIDGYVARRNHSQSQFGAILDPMMDKFFVSFALTALLLEHKLETWQLATMLTRDGFIFLYGIIMFAIGRWRTMVIRSIWWGKITTALQFMVLIGLVLGIAFPWYVFVAFAVLGWLAFLELFQVRTSTA